MAQTKQKYVLERNFEDFGAYLQEMRVASGLTQRDVALKLGYSSAQFISNFERGISLPPLNKLKILMKLYNMPKANVVRIISEARTKALSRQL